MSEAEDRRWYHISQEEYHGMDAVSSGALKCYEKEGPPVYWATYVVKTMVSEETKAKRMGTAFHAAMENPENWANGYSFRPDKAEREDLIEVLAKDRPEKSQAQLPVLGEWLEMKKPLHKAYVKLLEDEAAAAGKVLLTRGDHGILNRQVDAMYANPECAQYLDHRKQENSEATCVWQCPKTGLLLKALVDLVVSDTIIDFKTTMFLDPYDIIRQADKLGYPYQAAHYLYTTGFPRHLFLTVTSQEAAKKGCPVEANVFEVPLTKLGGSFAQNMKTMETLASIKLIEEKVPSEPAESGKLPAGWHSAGWGTVIPMDVGELAQERGP